MSLVRALLLVLLAASPSVGAADDVDVRVERDRLVASIHARGDGEVCGRAQLLDLSDVGVWQGEARRVFHGAGTLDVALDVDFTKVPAWRQSELTWYRLRYSAGPCGSAVRPATVSMSKVLRDAFEIHARGAEVTVGRTYRLWVRAVGTNDEAAPDVEIEARLGDGRATGRTGPDGVALLELPLDEDEWDHGDVVVTGRRRGFLREARLSVFTGSPPQVLISTDKALYQPGQVLHVRALLLDASRRPLALRDAAVRVRAPDGSVVLRRDVRASTFGVTASDWEIPADATTGTYRIDVGPRDSRNDDPWSGVEVEVSRYELPTFTVGVRPERPYSRPGEMVNVDVTAEFLSGEKVPRFSARIVKARSWWAWRGAREDREAEVVAAGDAGKDGAFRARLEVPSFKRSQWRVFEDTSFVAHVTDPSTGRTERRRFDLRSTIDPIHVYLVGDLARHPGLTSTIYVSTFYADGRPASCRVEVSMDSRPVGTLRTNRLGVGKLVTAAPAGSALKLVARDDEGLRGEGENGWLGDASSAKDPAVRVRAPKTLYRRGEAIEVEIDASYRDGIALVDVARDTELLRCETVPIRKGKGRLRIPFREDLVGAITIFAYPPSLTDEGGWRAPEGSSFRTVLFPDDRELSLHASLSKRSFRPGEKASARLTLRRRDGRPVVGELGVTVVDRAVEDRVADGEWSAWGPTPDPFTRPFRLLLETDEELAGFHVSDFHRLRPGKRVSPDVELVAEVLLNRWSRYYPRRGSSMREPRFDPLLEKSLARFRKSLLGDGRRLPRTEAELAERLDAAGEAPPRDPWDVPFRVEPGVEGTLDVLRMRSAGPDQLHGTPDDILAATLVVPTFVEEERAVRRALDRSAPTPSAAAPADASSPAVTAAPDSSAVAAGIHGVVTSEEGLPLPGVRVTCWEVTTSGTTRETVSNASGRFSFPGLGYGTYTVELARQGFATLRRRNVVVSAGQPASSLEVSLKLAQVAEEVVVTGESIAVETRVANATSDGKGVASRQPGGSPRRPMRTPRVREHFPETLVWEPSLRTGKDGNARLELRLADNITTWSLFAVASTERGEVGFTRTDFHAFQPFFVDYEPPRVLTVGDEVSPPVVMRSYQPREQRVEVFMSGPGWFRLLDGERREATVPRNDSRVETFRFRAESPVEAGRQRVTARGLGGGGDDGPADAIEKQVTVRVNADEASVARGGILRDEARLSCELPPEAIPGSARAKLTLYPNLVSQLADGIEGILQRPHGCAEQTVSLAYASVLMLRQLRGSGASRPALESRARGYVQSGVESLSSFDSGSGGVAYFVGGAPDAALTAYALSFLVDAESVLPIDAPWADRALEWLLRTQQADGGWSGPERGPRKLAVTALAARALARAKHRSPLALPAARRALSYLEVYVRSSTALGREEAYVLSSFALAAADAGDPAIGDAALERLRSLAERSRGEARWSGRDASPFFSWGRAGDLETTAMAAQALLRAGNDRDLAESALLYLLRERDSSGIWFSGHATIQALEALLTGVGASSANAPAGCVEIRVNGEALPPLDVPLGSEALDPITVDLSARCRPGDNEVVLTAPRGGTAAVQLTLRYGVPWKASDPSSDLGFAVSYDRTEARAGQEITASVLAGRRSSRGGGMLLAEVGIPPGAEVDRAGLADLVRDYGRGVHQYEIQPERVVFYVWPMWGRGDSTTTFSFRFRPRYPIRALSAPSALIDYYNPDERVSVPPVRFIVR